MTTGVTVAVVGSDAISKDLGKKGTASDVTLFNAVRDGHAVTLVEPTQFPEKLFPLVTALAMADRCLLVVGELSRPVAETIATVEVAGVPTTVVLGPAVGDAEIARLLKGGPLESAERVPLDLPALRARLDGWTAPALEGPFRVPLDHAFPVKGVGAVALGVVRRGTLRAHDRARLWPSPKAVEVRSIQVHDIDRKDAGCGERVGVALKGVDADELGRGQVLAPEGSLAEASRLAASSIARCRYYKGDAREGAQLHLSVGLQIVPAVWESTTPDGMVLAADRPVAFAPDEEGIILDLSAGAGPRVVGRVRLKGAA
jgi:selenocysteine-specific translation elongation factor